MTASLLICYNKGCGQKFDPNENKDGKVEKENFEKNLHVFSFRFRNLLLPPRCASFSRRLQRMVML